MSVPEPPPLTPGQAATDGALVVMAQRIATMERRILVLEAEVGRLAKLCGVGG